MEEKQRPRYGALVERGKISKKTGNAPEYTYTVESMDRIGIRRTGLKAMQAGIEYEEDTLVRFILFDDGTGTILSPADEELNLQACMQYHKGDTAKISTTARMAGAFIADNEIICSYPLPKETGADVTGVMYTAATNGKITVWAEGASEDVNLSGLTVTAALADGRQIHLNFKGSFGSPQNGYPCYIELTGGTFSFT